MRKQEENIRNLCYLCVGEKFPIGKALQIESIDLAQHVVDFHLPLKCDKCSKVFETAADLKDVDTCCSQVVTVESCFGVSIAEVSADNEKKEEIRAEQGTEGTENDDGLTPLTKINQRWRRKSKDFGKNEEQSNLVRTTSTPVQENLLVNNFTDSSSYSASSIQISSINCNYTSSSSESDGYSPPVVALKLQATSPKLPPPVSSRSRPKLAVQATPLRQVMSKSIQRAIEQHGHYRQTPLNLQQRKMSFNSTQSSSDGTISLMKFPTDFDCPLDLRLSAALRRLSEDENAELAMDLHDGGSENQFVNIRSHVEFEQIEVIIRRSEIKSESSAIANYQSCFSDSGRSGSLPDIQVTPKITSNNMLKKTISFETPRTVDTTPAFLLPIAKHNRSDDEDDDVFYTPRSTPTRIAYARNEDAIVPTDDRENVATKDSKSCNHLWNFVSSIIGAKKSEGSDEATDKAHWKFNFKKPGFVKKAADYFTKRSDQGSDEEHPSKRRRTSSTTRRSESQSSPVLKRQKIQARRPIGSTRKYS